MAGSGWEPIPMKSASDAATASTYPVAIKREPISETSVLSLQFRITRSAR